MPADNFYGRWYGNKVRRSWWSFLNWLKGYKFAAVQRYRCCDHTTPSHSRWCPKAQPSVLPQTGSRSGEVGR